MNSVEKYCRDVSRRLPVRREVRRRLLEGLATEISETLGRGCSMEEIIAAFGPPEQTAEELRQYIGPGEESASDVSGSAAIWPWFYCALHWC